MGWTAWDFALFGIQISRAQLGVYAMPLYDAFISYLQSFHTVGKAAVMPAILLSHWSVRDEATASLMIGTFRASARDPKLSRAEALRQSVLAMIEEAKSDTEADPRLWAPLS